MGPALQRWLAAHSSFQVRRARGQVTHPWQELAELEAQVDGLVVEGLDSRATAACLATLERAALLYEQRDFEAALQTAISCVPTIQLLGPAAELYHSNRELLIGNVYLVRDGNAAAASPYFQRAIEASGPTTVFVRGNAAINFGICQSLLNHNEEAIGSYQLALASYQAAGRPDKVAIALHSLGNAHRALGDVDTGIQFLHLAIDLHMKHNDKSGVWSVADDLSRAYLTIAGRRPEEREQWIERAAAISNGASFAATEVWKAVCEEEGRLADLSDQLANHTATRCEIAVLRNEPQEFLGTLALMKGRIRQSTLPISGTFLSSRSDHLQEGISLGVPVAWCEVVIDALMALSAGRTVALLDQFSQRGSELMMTYAIVSPQETRLGGFHTCLPNTADYDDSTDLRGRSRAVQLVRECQSLLDTLALHSRRCTIALPEDPATTDDNARQQLETWAAELESPLRRLGELFFPSEVLQEFRNRGVEHVVLSVDPYLASVPYSALIGNYGPIVDEPWSLSLVTASTELVRIVDRSSLRGHGGASLCWFGPDSEVNASRGGDREVQKLSQVTSVMEFREDNATVEQLLASLGSGKWCHFRGHGRWTGDVHTSGPVLAFDQVLCSHEYNRIIGTPGFLYTAACLTGFGEPVGLEIFGSLVDYDRAGLLGAVLTCWPIHGDAAETFSAFFYQHLKDSRDVAVALKVASQRTRAIMPHPYLWAPFALIGAWEVGDIVQWMSPEVGA